MPPTTFTTTLPDYLPFPLSATGVAGPLTAQSAAGTQLTIGGLQLTGASSVSFGNSPVASFTDDSNSQITATTLPGTAGTVDVTVTNDQGTSVISSQVHFTYQGAGYWQVASDGGIFGLAGAPFFDSMGGTPLNQGRLTRSRRLMRRSDNSRKGIGL